MRRVVTVALLLGVLGVLGVLAVSAPATAHATQSTRPVPADSVIHACGYMTCTSYWSRDYTKNVLEPATEGGVMVFAGVMATLCSEGGPPAAVACGGMTAAVAGWSFGAISQAAANNQCAAFVTDIVGHVGWFRTDNSGYCVDK